MFSYSLTIGHCNCLPLMRRWEGMELLEIFGYGTVAVVHFTDQNLIRKTVHCVRFVMVCKIGFTDWNAKIAFLRASMVVTYFIKLSRMGADRHNGILMSLLLLVAETIISNNLTVAPILSMCQTIMAEWSKIIDTVFKLVLILDFLFVHSLPGYINVFLRSW